VEKLSMRRAVLFDVDGTLAETELDGHRVAFNAAYAAAGLRWHWDERLYVELLQVSGGRERITAYARRHDAGWLALPGSMQRIAALHEDKNRRYGALVAAGAIGLRPGVRELLDELARAGWMLALVTTTSRGNVEALLTATLGTHAGERFAACVCGEDVMRKKPAADAYELALRRLGLHAEQAIAVEDSSNGLLAARAASIATVIVRSRALPHEDYSGAVEVFDGYRSAATAGLDAHILDAVIGRLRIAADL
jgi:HAD superfamily hydrolase (TIGR01509 family)